MKSVSVALTREAVVVQAMWDLRAAIAVRLGIARTAVQVRLARNEHGQVAPIYDVQGNHLNFAIAKKRADALCEAACKVMNAELSGLAQRRQWPTTHP